MFDRAENLASPLVYVLAGEVGEIGGASRATMLLAEALVQLGTRVRLFVTSPPTERTTERLRSSGIDLELPLRLTPPRHCPGWRWGVPQRVIALQVYLRALSERPRSVIVVSLRPEARFLLRLPRTVSVLPWESTEALPHGTFFDHGIGEYLHRASSVLVPSATIASNLRRTYSYTGAINLLPFWVEPPTRPVVPIDPKRRRNFLYLGRLSVEKGLPELVSAFSVIRERHHETTLTICGGGAQEAVRSLIADKYGITLRGYVDAEEHEEVLRSCDALVLPSYEEGYPLALLEASARAKPVIATSVGSVPEVFGGRQCALLVPPRQPLPIAAAMEKLLLESDAEYTARCQDALSLFEEVSAPNVVRDRLRSILALNVDETPKEDFGDSPRPVRTLQRR